MTTIFAWNANALGGDFRSMKCDPGEVIVSVEENAVRCTPAFDGSFTPGACPAGCHATGFQANACRPHFSDLPQQQWPGVQLTYSSNYLKLKQKVGEL
jgi:hypothetical protein